MVSALHAAALQSARVRRTEAPAAGCTGLAARRRSRLETAGKLRYDRPVSSNKIKPSPGGTPESENATLVAPPELAAQLFRQHPPEGSSENATLRAPPELAAQLFGQPSSDGRGGAATEPPSPAPDAHALDQLHDTSPSESMSRALQQLHEVGPTESMSRALQQLHDTSPSAPTTPALAQPQEAGPSESTSRVFEQLHDVGPSESMSRALQQLNDTSPTESMSRALEQLNDATADARAGDEAPNLNSLALQFGAASQGAAVAAARPPGSEAAPAPSRIPKLRAPSVVDLQMIRPEGAGLELLKPGPPPTLTERVRDAVDGAVDTLRETGAPKVKGALSGASATLRTRVPESYARLLDFVRARLPEKHRGLSQRALGLGVGAVLLLPVLILILVLALSGDGS